MERIWKILFPREDSNPHKQIQSLPCYHYTTGERFPVFWKQSYTILKNLRLSTEGVEKSKGHGSTVGEIAIKCKRSG